MQAEDLFGRLVATGIVCWFAFQAFENIGMTLGIMPVDGRAAAVRLLRRLRDVRQPDRRRAAADHSAAHAPLRVTRGPPPRLDAPPAPVELK